MEKLLLEQPEALATLGIGKTLLGKLEAEGFITPVRLGRRKLYLAQSLRAYVDRLQAEAAGGR